MQLFNILDQFSDILIEVTAIRNKTLLKAEKLV